MRVTDKNWCNWMAPKFQKVYQVGNPSTLPKKQCGLYALRTFVPQHLRVETNSHCCVKLGKSTDIFNRVKQYAGVHEVYVLLYSGNIENLESFALKYIKSLGHPSVYGEEYFSCDLEVLVWAMLYAANLEPHVVVNILRHGPAAFGYPEFIKYQQCVEAKLNIHCDVDELLPVRRFNKQLLRGLLLKRSYPKIFGPRPYICVDEKTDVVMVDDQQVEPVNVDCSVPSVPSYIAPVLTLLQLDPQSLWDKLQHYVNTNLVNGRVLSVTKILYEACFVCNLTKKPHLYCVNDSTGLFAYTSADGEVHTITVDQLHDALTKVAAERSFTKFIFDYMFTSQSIPYNQEWDQCNIVPCKEGLLTALCKFAKQSEHDAQQTSLLV